MKTRMDAIRRKAIAWVTMTSMILAMAVHFGAPVMAGMAGGTWLDEFAPGDLMYADFDWYDEADGTALDPYILSTAADFAGLAYVVNSGGSGVYDENSFAGEYFKVADGAVIDFAGHTWISIGTADYPFSGNFDGNNITLAGITVNNGTVGNFGFFGYVKSQGTSQRIENIVLSEPSVTGRFRLGALIGSIESTTALTLGNCHVNGGTINATDANSGGLVGEIIADAPLTLENCSTETDMMGQANTGGLVGHLKKNSFGADIEIRGCHTTGRIVGSVQTGGLIGLIYNNAEYGENTPILIENCYTTGDVLADGGQAGGLIGYADNGNLGVEIMVSRCYSTGDIFGAEGAGTDFGGLIGQIFAGGGGTNQISNCYAMGNAEGYRAVGGLIGTVSMWGNTTLDIINGYATGNAKAYDTSSDGYAGGIIGKYNTNSAPMSALNLSNMLALNASVTGGAGSCHRILGGQVNANGTMTGTANRAFEEMLLGVTDSGSYASISSADSTGTEGGDVDRASVNDSALTESYFDAAASAGAWTFSDTALPKLGLADTGIPMPQHLRLPGPEILVVSDFTAMVGATVRVTVGEDGTLYLVPKAAYADQDALDAVSDNQYTAACTANTFASLETGSLDPGIYQIYAVNSAGSLSDPTPDIILSSGAGGLSASAGSTDYYLSGPSVVIDAGLAMTGFGADNIDQASVMIRNKLSGDTLVYPEPIGAITGSYNASTGILTLSGTDTPANYQSALRSVKFSTTSDSLAARIIDFSVGGGLFYEGTGHFYEYVDHGGSITWGAAKTAAESEGLFGREGYLVTIGSEGENTFVQSKTAGLGWIGAEDVNHPDGSGASSGDWRWVSGPEGLADSGAGFAFWSGFAAGTAVNGAYARWAGSEPNNHMNTEYAAHVYGPDSDNPGYWNDFSPSNASAMGYIVEYGGMPDDTPLNVIGTKSVDVARYYNVSYSGNGSTGGTAPTDAESYLTDDTVTVLGNTGSLIRTGYTFDGWNTAANGSGTAYSGGGTFAMGSSNVTLYAQWAPVDYTVTYNGNGNTGGAVPTDGNTYNITDTVTVPGNTGSLVRTGYTFDGWNTAANGSGTAYSGADTFAMGSSNVTLYAQWAPVDYTVTYNGNGNTGGAVPVDAGLYNITDTVTVLGNTGSLVRTGYTYDGWDTAANGGGTAYSGGGTFAMGSSNVTLYAQWAPVDYTVTYDGNGNTGGTVPVDAGLYNITDTVTVLGNTGSLVRTGFTFDGWDTAANGSGTAYSGADTFAMGSSNVTLYAQWAPSVFRFRRDAAD